MSSLEMDSLFCNLDTEALFKLERTIHGENDILVTCLWKGESGVTLPPLTHTYFGHMNTLSISQYVDLSLRI